MGLSQSDAAVDKEGIVKRSRGFRHGFGGGVSYRVGIAHHETVECISGIEHIDGISVIFLFFFLVAQSVVVRFRFGYYLYSRDLGSAVFDRLFYLVFIVFVDRFEAVEGRDKYEFVVFDGIRFEILEPHIEAHGRQQHFQFGQYGFPQYLAFAHSDIILFSGAFFNKNLYIMRKIRKRFRREKCCRF